MEVTKPLVLPVMKVSEGDSEYCYVKFPTHVQINGNVLVLTKQHIHNYLVHKVLSIFLLSFNFLEKVNKVVSEDNVHVDIIIDESDYRPDTLMYLKSILEYLGYHVNIKKYISKSGDKVRIIINAKWSL